MEAGAGDIADMMLHCEFFVNENYTNNLCCLDNVSADRKYEVSAGQLLNTLPYFKLYELLL